MAEEKRFENRVKKFLKEKGCWFIKYCGGGYFTKSGIPDLLVCCNGRFVAIELKASTGEPSTLQLHNLQKIDESGGYGILLYPEDFPTFESFIKSLFDSNQTVTAILYKRLKGVWNYGKSL